MKIKYKKERELKQKTKKQNFQRQKGITLIALVITIIVLLILAGVSIATLTGDNGILTKAQTAKTETEKASEEEQIKLAAMNAAMNKEQYYYETGEKDEDGNPIKVPIPAGFAPTQIEGQNSIKDGVVVVDEKRNEFVWIPVDKNLKVKGTEKLMAKESTVKQSTDGKINYEGVLYDFKNTESTVKSNYGQSTIEYREPAYLTDSNHNGDNSNYNKDTNGNEIVTEESLQKEYNEMIESVKINEGFYIGRYEMGIDKATNTAVSKAGPATDALQDDTKMWYGLYTMAKTYKNEYNSIKSSMIWGSQYDAMLNYALTNKSEAKKVTETGRGYVGKTAINTGATQDDILLNVYDLAGNHYEWTLEANTTWSRVSRGASWNWSGSPSVYSGYNYPYGKPDEKKFIAFFSTRLTFYITNI